MTGHFFAVLLIFFIGNISAATNIGGILSKDTRFKVADGPFILQSDLFVPKNIRLTISPGVKICIQPGGQGDTALEPFDALDRSLISIRIAGTLSCIGKRDNRISIQPDSSANKIAWYGILFENTDDQFNEIAFTTISGAHCGLTVKKASVCVRNTIFEYNNFGIIMNEGTEVSITNCGIMYNRNSGIKTSATNAFIGNCIIAYNKNNGFWCDGKTKVDIVYNCIASNYDGNFFECDPEFGISVKTNRRGDSTDIYNNIYSDPVFCGSVAESNAIERDLATPTDKSSVKNRIIAAIINSGMKEAPAEPPPCENRFTLSPYSPCIDAGDPAGKYKDADGSKNDIGILGGPDFLDRK